MEKTADECLASKNVHLQAVGKHLRNFQRDFLGIDKVWRTGLGRVIVEAVLYFRGFDLKKLNLGAGDCPKCRFQREHKQCVARLLSLGNVAVHYDARDSTPKDYVNTLRYIFTVLSLSEIADELWNGNKSGTVVKKQVVSGEFQAWLNARRTKSTATKWQAVGRRYLIHLFARQGQRRMAALKVQRSVRGFLRSTPCRILAATKLTIRGDGYRVAIPEENRW